LGGRELRSREILDGFVFRDGKIIQYLSFAERAQALEWAGIAE
jgi:hypothetical protein